MKREFEIEFTLLDKHLKVKLSADSKEDALSELLKVLMAKTKVHSVTETKTNKCAGYT